MKVISDTNIEKEAQRFFEGVKQSLDIWRRAEVVLDLHLARKFNFFHSIDFFSSIPPKEEDRMSYVLAYLLNPDETHGQGDLFLRKFLEDVAPNWLPNNCWSFVSVRTEVQTTRIKRNREIDIMIAFDGNRTAIAIENKPWEKSTDLDQQLNDYARHLESMYEGCFKLIYLTPDGRDPCENSITCKERKELEKKFVKASIKNWADGWLKRAEDEVKAERVRWFVSDFRKALKNLPAQQG